MEHRVCYVAKFAEAIYVLHAFEKRAGKRRNAMSSLPDNAIRHSWRSAERCVEREGEKHYETEDHTVPREFIPCLGFRRDEANICWFERTS